MNNSNTNTNKSITDKKIENAEDEGRKVFLKNIQKYIANAQDIRFTKTTETYDAVVDADNKSFVIEIKKNTITSDKYKTAIIKETKFNSMTAHLVDGYIPLYFLFFSDNTVLVWDLSKQDIIHSKTELYVRKTQMNVNSEMEYQPFYLLHKDTARRYTYQD